MAKQPKFNKKRSSRAKKSVRKTRSVALSVKRYVKRAIHSQIENKSYSTEQADTLSNPANPVAFQAGNIIQLTPSNATNSAYTIVQNVGQGGRIGNAIHLRKATFKCIMYPQQYNVTSNPTPKPLDVCIYIFSIKQGICGATVADAWTRFNTDFFGNGNSSNGTLNNLYDAVSDVNSDVVHLYYKRIVKLGASAAQLQTGGSAALSNNDYKYNQMLRIPITKYLPKKITFNDTDNNSTSKQVYLLVCPYNADGTTQPSTTLSLSMFWGIDLIYEDA